jgi:asparagine synthase (glutamine-hydrolysing)
VLSVDSVVLGHRRLAILDASSRANQPMLSSDERYAIVFNGEIYNFNELRGVLKSEGVAFRTSSDTEVLLALYAKHRERMLSKLRGMFAFAIWDSLARDLFLARDPYGIKPLYYANTRYGLIFASQVKALAASAWIDRDEEPAARAGFYLWGNVPEPWTCYRDVFAMPAGHWLRVRNGVSGNPVCWHDIGVHWRGIGSKPPHDQLQSAVRSALTESVSAHLVSDVPISIFLSGGVDSSVVAGLASELGAHVKGITISFAEFVGRSEDEAPIAADTAAFYGLPHEECRVSRDDFLRDLPSIVDAMDQPSIDGLNVWFAAKAAASRGYKVVLSGLGGDELFCGYSSFTRVPRAVAFGRTAALPGLDRLLNISCKWLASRFLQPKIGALASMAKSLESAYFLTRCLFLPEELPTLMGTEMAHAGLSRLGGEFVGLSLACARDSAASVGLLESTIYLRNQLLRDADWASMAHSVELRTPMVDIRLLAALGGFVAAFTKGAGKALISQSPAMGVPSAVTSRRKTGFGLPISEWLQLRAPGRRRVRATSSWARTWAKTVLPPVR